MFLTHFYCGLESCELFGAAGSAVERDIGELVDWDARSDSLAVERSMGSIGVEALEKGTDRGADSAVHGIPDETRGALSSWLYIDTPSLGSQPSKRETHELLSA
jgi:hypothetical protein